MKRILIFCLLLAAFAGLSGCNIPTAPAAGSTVQAATGTPLAGETPSPLPSFTAIPSTPTQSPVDPGIFSLDMLKNFTYTVEDPTIQVALKNGEYTGDHLNSRFIEPAAFGDLNGDGRPDAVVVIATNTGGSGTFFDLVPLLDQNGTPVQASFSPFGDRQMVKNLTIENGRVVLDYLTQKPSDGLCCPSEHRLRSYLLDHGVLRLASEQVLVNPGEQAAPLPDAILIDQPEMGGKLSTPMQVSGRVTQVPPEKKLAYYVTDYNATLLAQGEVPVEGEVGGPGTFAFEFKLDSLPPSIYKIEVVDTANGILRGRSMVEVYPPQ